MLDKKRGVFNYLEVKNMKKKNMIFRFFIQHKFSYLVGILFMFLSAWSQTLFPTVLGEAIDTLESLNFTHQMMIHYILIIIGIGVGTFICTYIWRNLIIRNARTLECRLRESLFIHLQKLSPSFYKEHKKGDLIAYAINDISAVRMAFGPLNDNIAVLILNKIDIINFQLT